MARTRVLAAAVVAITLASTGAPAQQSSIPQRLSDRDFWRMVTDMSEPGGYFRSDNFLSNETTFQWVVPKLLQDGRGSGGGVYLGVGPEQNFTYIAALRPRIAFIFDIRRQNLIEHLMYKALIEAAPTRAELVSKLFGRRLPEGAAMMSVDSLFASAVTAPPDSALHRSTLAAVEARLVRDHGFGLDSADLRALEYVYGAFFQAGPEMTYTFSPGGRGFGRGFMPTYAALMRETDSAGMHRSWLADDASYGIVRDLELRNLVVPVVGDFAGPKAIRSVGDWLRAHNATVTAFYLSNVEQYLFRQNDDANRFFENAATLPADSASVFLRALFRYGFMAPQPNPGRRSETLMCPIAGQVAAFRSGTLKSYDDIAKGCR